MICLFAGCVGFINFLYPACSWQRVDKGTQLPYEDFEHLFRYGRYPLCYRPAGSAICSDRVRCNSPSIPSGIQLCRQVCHVHRPWFFAKIIGRIVVIRGIKAHVLYSHGGVQIRNSLSVTMPLTLSWHLENRYVFW